MYLRFGDRGDIVLELQIALGDVKADGIFGRMTEASVKNYQKKNGMMPDGIVTPELLEKIMDISLSTDTTERIHMLGDIAIDRYYLPHNEYVSEEITDKNYLFLHHTAGQHNPYKTIDMWAKDDRGRIGTHYVIGGIGLDGNTAYDGLIVEAMPVKNWAYHLGRVDKYMHSHSIGIEICSYGWLDNGKTWAKNKVPHEYIHTLKRPFRGFKTYHKYTDKQIESLAKLIPFLVEKHGINAYAGLKYWLKQYDPHEALEYWTDAVTGKVRGILSHTNVRKDKTDIYPHDGIMDILSSL